METIMRKSLGIIAATLAAVVLALGTPNVLAQSTVGSSSSTPPVYASTASAPSLTMAKGWWEGSNRASGDLVMQFHDTPDGPFNAQVWFGGASNCYGPRNASGMRTGMSYHIQMQTQGCGHLDLKLTREGSKISGSYMSNVYGDGMVSVSF